MTNLPLAPLKRIAKKAGVERMSDKAVEELRDIVEEISDDLARDAIVATRHAGRKTVKARDIKLVSK